MSVLPSRSLFGVFKHSDRIRSGPKTTAYRGKYLPGKDDGGGGGGGVLLSDRVY